jgi:FkbM family methyltransferase
MVPTKALRFMAKYACSDPMGFADMMRRRAVEQFSTTGSGIAQTKFADVTYEIDLSLHKLTRKYLYHAHEMYLERVFDRFLFPGGTFIDIGANCGYWSAYALAKVRQQGEVHAFEPVTQYFSFLRRLAELNPDFKLFPNNVACGSHNERRPMVVVQPRRDNFDNHDTNIGSSSLASGFLAHAEDLTKTVDVNVIALDDYLRVNSIDLDRIALIKIDVEGFEICVFSGMSSILSKEGRKVPILCEVLTDVRRKFPLDGAQIVARLERCGYSCLNALTLRPIDPTNLGFEENIVCV